MNDLELIKKVIKAREDMIKQGVPYKDVNSLYPPSMLNKMITEIGVVKKFKGGLTTKKKTAKKK
jgi:hypothetical protein